MTQKRSKWLKGFNLRWLSDVWKLQTDNQRGDVITTYKYWRTRETWRDGYYTELVEEQRDGRKTGNFGMDCERDIQSLTILGFNC